MYEHSHTYQNVDILMVSNIESGELDGYNRHNYTISLCVINNFFHQWAINWLQC